MTAHSVISGQNSRSGQVRCPDVAIRVLDKAIFGQLDVPSLLLSVNYKWCFWILPVALIVLIAVANTERSAPEISPTLADVDVAAILPIVRRELRRETGFEFTFNSIKHLPTALTQLWFHRRIRTVAEGPAGTVEVLTGGDPGVIGTGGFKYYLMSTTNGWIILQKGEWFDRHVYIIKPIVPNPARQ